MSSFTIGCLTPFSIPSCSCRAHTRISLQNLPIGAGDQLHTKCSIPSTVEGTFTHELENIPFSSFVTDLHGGTTVSVPSGVGRTFTHTFLSVEYFASRATYTLSSIPIQSSWALAFIVVEVEELSFRALLHTSRPIPVMTLATINTHIFSSGKVSIRAKLSACTVEGERIAWAIRTLGAK